MIRTESYFGLCHGTDHEAAEKILQEGFKFNKGDDSWCGSGIYFYDIKAKAYWSAKRTCNVLKSKTRRRYTPTVIFADIIDISRCNVLDLRAPQDFDDFLSYVSRSIFTEEIQLLIDKTLTDEEQIIKLRSLLISFYAAKTNKKLIIGVFGQGEQPKHSKTIEIASSLKLVIGVETIYCVRDGSILQNIRQRR